MTGEKDPVECAKLTRWLIRPFLCSVTEATVSRHVITPPMSSGTWRWQPGWAELQVWPFWLLAASPSRSSNATAPGLGMSQPWSRNGVQSSWPELLRQPLTWIYQVNNFLHLSRRVASCFPPPKRRRIPVRGVRTTRPLPSSLSPKRKWSWLSRKCLENLKYYSNKVLLLDSI